MPETMTKQAEARILDALEKVALAVQDGAEPDPAIAKVAADLNLPPGHVALVCNAYNIGRSARQREDGPDPMEKGADFALADAAAVLDRIFPDRVKTAAQVDRDGGISPEYLIPADRWYGRARRERAVKAATAAIDWSLGATAPPPLPRDPAYALRKAAGDRDRARNTLTEARTKRAQAERVMLGGFAKIAELVAEPRRPALADIRNGVEVLFGKAGTAVLDQVARNRPGLAKAAARSVLHDARKEPVYTAVEYTVKAAREFLDLDRAVERAQAAAERPAPFDDGPVSAVLVGLDEPGEEKRAAGLNVFDKLTNAGIFTGVTRLGNTLQPPSRDESVDRTMQELGSPDHEQKLRALHAQAMLHEMMLDDPIISGGDPADVARIYNRISQFAPSVASQPLTAIPLMRKQLQTGQPLDQFESGAIADTENKLNQQPIAGLDAAQKTRDLMKRQPPFAYEKTPHPLMKYIPSGKHGAKEPEMGGKVGSP